MVVILGWYDVVLIGECRTGPCRWGVPFIGVLAENIVIFRSVDHGTSETENLVESFYRNVMIKSLNFVM